VDLDLDFLVSAGLGLGLGLEGSGLGLGLGLGYWWTCYKSASWYLTKPPRPTQPGHPSLGRQNEY